MTRCVTREGSSNPELMYVLPRSERIEAKRKKRSNKYKMPGTMNHFQKFGPWKMTNTQNGMYSRCVQQNTCKTVLNKTINPNLLS